VKPRKLFALKENHATSGAREQRCGRAAGRSASYDRDVVHAAAHAHDGSVAWIAFKERRLPSRHVQNRRLPKPSFLGTPTPQGGVLNLLC
jgi:hypothetical protein